MTPRVHAVAVEIEIGMIGQADRARPIDCRQILDRHRQIVAGNAVNRLGSHLPGKAAVAVW